MSVTSLYFCLALLLVKANLKFGAFAARNAFLCLLIGLAVAPLTTTENWYQYLVVILLSLSIHRAASAALPSKEAARVVSTALVSALSILAVNSAYFDDRLSETALIAVRFARAAFPSWTCLNVGFIQASLLILIGFYLVAFEANYIVLLIINTIPRVATSASEALIVDKNKGMGRIIGILERGIVYVLVITSNLPLIGFIIAVKALARFKELEKKDFAEYFIIGTMSSLLITISLSLVVKNLLA
jgi:hypothetical protein